MNKIFAFIMIFLPVFAFGQKVKMWAIYPLEKYPVSFTREEPFPFIWSDTTGQYAPYVFSLYEILKGQTPEDAIKYNKPIYSQTDVQLYYLNYPWNAPSLSSGDYVFQVVAQKDKDIRALGRLKISIDSVPLHPSLTLKYYNYYVPLKEAYDGSYQMAYDKRLYIHYQEFYKPAQRQGLRFIIRNMNREILVETDEAGVVLNNYAPSIPIRYRDNYVVINLETCPGIFYKTSVPNAYYTLEVWNEKREYFFLRFACDPSKPIFQLQ